MSKICELPPTVVYRRAPFIRKRTIVAVGMILLGTSGGYLAGKQAAYRESEAHAKKVIGVLEETQGLLPMVAAMGKLYQANPGGDYALIAAHLADRVHRQNQTIQQLQPHE